MQHKAYCGEREITLIIGRLIGTVTNQTLCGALSGVVPDLDFTVPPASMYYAQAKHTLYIEQDEKRL
jgi:hypothetical protein